MTCRPAWKSIHHFSQELLVGFKGGSSGFMIKIMSVACPKTQS